MKKFISFILTISLLCPLLPHCTATADESLPTINVSMTTKRHDILHGSAGFLYGISNEGVPDINTLSPLKPKVLATKGALGTEHPYGDALDVADEFFESGGEQIQMYNSNYYGVFGVTANAYEYGEVLKTIIAPHVSQWKNTMREKYPDIDNRMVYIPINEGTPVNGVANFNEAWKIYYNSIKASDSTAVIAGPNDAVYRGHNSMYSFLKFCRDNSCLPDIISWHELQVGCLNTMDEHIADYRSICRSLGIAEQQIVINEYADYSDCGVPGRLTNWIARLEDNRVYGCLPFWHQANNLNDLTANANDGNGAWWVYKWYGDMSGSVLGLSAKNTTFDKFYGLASYDENKKSATVIVGGNDGDGIVNLNNIGKTSVFKNESHVSVKVEASYFTGYHGASGEPEVIMEGVFPIVDGNVQIRLSDMLFSTAYRISISQTESTTAYSVCGKYRALYEAEDASHYGNLIIEDEFSPLEKPRYFASGRVRVGGFDEEGDGICYNITVPHDALYRLSFIYGNGVGSTRNNAATHVPKNITQSLFVDNEEFTLHLPNTLFYSMEGMADFDISLTEGFHKIRIMYSGDSGAFHDALYISQIGAYGESEPVFDQIFESEEADFNPNCESVAESSLSGFSGSGYVTNLSSISTEEGGGIRHVVRVPESALYNISFRYSSESDGDIRIFLDNTNLTYTNHLTDIPVTENEDWSIAYTTVFLRSGLNLIDYDMTCEGSIDLMRVTRAEADESVTYQAEDAEGSFEIFSNGSVLGAAPLLGSDSAYSDNYLKLNVTAPYTGLYKMQVFQSNNDLCGTHSYNIKIIDRYASFAVNEDFENAKRYFFPNTFSDDTFLEKTIPLNLKEGENTIHIYNDNSWNVLWGGTTSTPGTNTLENYTPNFDKFIITPAVADAPLSDFYTIAVSASPFGLAYCDKNTASSGEEVNLYLIPEGDISSLTLNGEDILPRLRTTDDTVYTTSFIMEKDTKIIASFTEPVSSDIKEDTDSTVTIDGKVYQIKGENLYSNPTFSDNSGANMENWFTGVNAQGHPSSTNYPIPKINHNGTFENLTPISESGYLTTGAFEKDGNDTFYYGRDSQRTYLVEHMASNWQSCAWNGEKSLLSYIPIKENTNYYFAFDAFTVSGKASVRFGAIDMDDYVPAAYATNASLKFTSKAFDCNNGDMQNVGGAWNTYSLAFNSGENADYFFFNAYWLQMAEYLCMGNFRLFELSAEAETEIVKTSKLPVQNVFVGTEPALPSSVEATDENGGSITCTVNWLTSDIINTHLPGIYMVNGEILPPEGYYIADKYITLRVNVTQNACSISTWTIKDNSATIYIDCYSSLNATMLIAEYEDDMLLSVISRPLILAAGETIDEIIPLGKNTRVFIWNVKSAKPLSGAKHIK